MKRADDGGEWKRIAIRNAEESKKWQDRYYAEHQRIVDLALEHSPKIDASNEDGLPGFGKTISLSDDKQPEFTCNARGCCFFWPCPTYLWATGSRKFKLVIEDIEKPHLTGDV